MEVVPKLLVVHLDRVGTGGKTAAVEVDAVRIEQGDNGADYGAS
jgi:hypothetical protein